MSFPNNSESSIYAESRVPNCRTCAHTHTQLLTFFPFFHAGTPKSFLLVVQSCFELWSLRNFPFLPCECHDEDEGELKGEVGLGFYWKLEGDYELGRLRDELH